MRYFAQHGSILLLSVLLLLNLGACGREPSLAAGGWQQGPAITLPHIVSQIDGLQLSVVQEAEKLRLVLQCLQQGSYDSVEIDVRDQRGSIRQHIEHAAVECTAADEVVLTEPLTTITGVGVGERLTISLAIPPQGVGVAKRETIYMMGTDRQLRQGAGSVYR